MSTESLLNNLLLIAWLLVAIAILTNRLSRNARNTGIVLVYVASMIAEHWIPALVFALPWYKPVHDPAAANIGFFYSFVAMSSFAIGVIWIGPSLVKRTIKSPSWLRIKTEKNGVQINKLPVIPFLYLAIGVLSYLFLTGLTRFIPTLGSLTSMMLYLVQVGILAIYSLSSQNGSKLGRILVLVSIIVVPVVNVVQNGQAWLGVWSAALIMFYIISSNKRDLIVFGLLVVSVIIAISFFVSYFSVRNSIRQVVWREQDLGLVARIESAATVFEDFQLFDVTNSRHLFTLDTRFNQNTLLGFTVQRIESGEVNLAYGGTVLDAFIALIPRAIWPDKPVFAGGSSRLGFYSGVYYAEGTASNPGHVMETYINFGVLGIVGGFIAFGAVIAALDDLIYLSAQESNWFRFASIMLPSLSLLFPSHHFVLVVGGVVSGVISMVAINLLISASVYPSLKARRHNTFPN